MKSAYAVVCALSALLIATVAYGTDRNADMIQQIEARYRTLDKVDTAGVMIRGETPLPLDDTWSLVTDMGWSQIIKEGYAHDNLWALDLGLKHYFFPSTSASLLGSIDWSGGNSDFVAAGATGMIEQRIQPADARISPYVQGAISVRNVGSEPWESVSTGGDFTSWVATLVIGCDAMINDSTAVTARAEWWDGLSASDKTRKDWANGWVGALGLKYYWN